MSLFKFLFAQTKCVFNFTGYLCFSSFDIMLTFFKYYNFPTDIITYLMGKKTFKNHCTDR